MDERVRADRSMDVHSASGEDADAAADAWSSAEQRIAAARLRAGLTDVEVARRLNMTIHSYCDLERYPMKPSP